MDVDLAGKRLDLIRQVVPRLKRIGALGNPADNVWEAEWRGAQAAAQRLNIEIVPVLVNTSKELEAVFSGINRKLQALLVAPQAFFAVHRRRLIDLATLNKLPTIHERKAFPEAGAIMSYGPSYAALLRKTASHVDKILKGTRPADLPVEQPTEYELVINLKTAKTLGLRVPQAVLIRADEVIG
jgi:putative tryptophan/tyrosine transport system substrate-binding protein